MGSRARGEHHQVPTSDLDTGKAHHPVDDAPCVDNKHNRRDLVDEHEAARS